MGWFDGQDFPVPSPADGVQDLSLDRVRAALRRMRCNFGEKESSLYANFDHFYTVFEVSKSRYFLNVYSWSSGAYQPADRLGAALEWANDWNRHAFFGTAHAFLDSDQDVTLRVDNSFFSGVGSSDKQIENFLNIAIGANTQAMREYIKAFNIQRVLPDGA